VCISPYFPFLPSHFRPFKGVSGSVYLSTTKLLVPDQQKLLSINCGTVELVENATRYECEISLATNDLNIQYTIQYNTIQVYLYGSHQLD